MKKCYPASRTGFSEKLDPPAEATISRYEYNGTGNFEDFGPSAMGEWDDEIRATKLEHRHQCDDEIDVYDEGSKLLKCGLRKFRKHFEHCYPAFKKNESYSFYRSCDNKIPAQKDDKNSPEFIERHEKSYGDGRSGPVTRSSGENYENGTPQKLTEDDDPQKSTEDDTPPKLTEDPGVAASTKNPEKGGRSLETDGENFINASTAGRKVAFCFSPDDWFGLVGFAFLTPLLLGTAYLFHKWVESNQEYNHISAVLEAVRCDNDLLQDRVDRLEAYLMRLQRETLSSREEGKCLYSKCTEMVHNKEELKNKVCELMENRGVMLEVLEKLKKTHCDVQPLSEYAQNAFGEPAEIC